MEGTIRCEWFKLYLEPQALRDPVAIDPRLPLLPVSKHAPAVISLTESELARKNTS